MKGEAGLSVMIANQSREKHQRSVNESLYLLATKLPEMDEKTKDRALRTIDCIKNGKVFI